MQNEIYGLIAQAEDIQKHAITLQHAAQDAIKTLPDASRTAVRDAAREFITEGAEKANRSLLDASRGAIAAAEELRGAQTGALLRHILILSLVAVVLCACIGFGLGWWVKRQTAELDELTAQARAMQATVEKLKSQYGKAVFSMCDGRPCVRVDERPGRYGDAKNLEVYMILFGY